MYIDSPAQWFLFGCRDYKKVKAFWAESLEPDFCFFTYKVAAIEIAFKEVSVFVSLQDSEVRAHVPRVFIRVNA
ncbi:hypothetical protein APT63_08705 [Pseudomonas sp. 22-AL-CL-001]|nr:hypothetical protein APT63_08705 [Pseudomonas monteilii]